MSQPQLRLWQPRVAATCGLAATAALVATLAACSEPIDCERDPGRCQPPQASTLAVAAAAPKAVAVRVAQPADPALAEAAAMVARRRAVADGQPGPDRAGKLMARPAMLPGDTLAARTRDGQGVMMAPRDREMGAKAGEEDRVAAARKVLAAVLPAIRAHSYEQLKAHASARFAGQFDEIRSQHDQRFWNHVDRYVGALTGARLDLTIEPSTDGRVQGALKAAEGTELKPIFVFEGGSWKIDRF